MEDTITSSLDQFHRLKQQKLENKKLNQKALSDLLHHKRPVASDTPQTLPDNETPEAIRQRYLNYTIEECELWNEKQSLARHNKSESTYLNFNKLAAMSYSKEMANMNVDTAAYDSSRNRYHDGPLDLHTPNAEDVQSLVDNLQSANSRRTMRKAREDTAGSYINDKNKQFNLKLNRQYDSKS